MHFVTPFTHVSRHPKAEKIKEKENFRENCFKKCGLRFVENLPIGQQKYLKKSAKTNKKSKNYFFFLSVNNLWQILGTKLVILVDF